MSNYRLKIGCVIIFFMALLSIYLNDAMAQGIPSLLPKEEMKGFKKSAPVIVNGDKIEYFHEEKRIVGSGNISITYGDTTLTCDRITVYTDKKVGMCEGNVKITQPQGRLEGDSIEYNFVEKTGALVNGYVRADPLYARSEKVEKVSENKVVFDKGDITTCDLDKPHYRIQARQVRFYLDDKVVCNHVFFFIGSAPVFYVPYYYQPIKDVKTKISLIPGYKKDWGYYVLGAYRYQLNDKVKGYLRLDYRERKGLAEGVDYHYDTEGLGEGLARVYFAQENSDLTIRKSGEHDDRWRLQYKHTLDFTEDTRGMLEINKLSDENVIKDYFYNEYEEGAADPDNYISLISSKRNYSFEVLLRKRVDDFFTVTEKFPEAHLEVYNQRLWNTFFYYYNDVTFTNFQKKYQKSVNLEDEARVRADTYNKLSYAAKVFRWLYATPYIATRQTYYSKNKWDKDNLIRQIYEYGLDLTSKFYKTFDVNSELMNINGLRHIFNPTVGFFHRRQPSISFENLVQFDTVDGLDYENYISLMLENKLQTKRRSGDGWESLDLIRFIVSTNYNYRFKKGSVAFKDDGHFSDIRFQLEVRPFDWVYGQTDVIMNYKDCGIKTANSDLVFELNEKFKFAMGHIYEGSETNSADQFTIDATYKINKDWSVRAYERFDVYDGTWQEQEYTLYKDLHCWLAEFTCNIKENDYSFWVTFRIKAFPDLPIGFQRTLSRPSPGSERL